ncbi:serine/threonine protein kinase, bacterial [Fibrella aestuarina BUZ 2]|uniref:Serine/threonine protein kinase, bacterial n=2 Tax=Fibrella TaxID=861914 RepID=I0K669_9BACT|nr:serine/threonine protein kinase, bacterial [Fibrella aestuarina BUZ 2]
MATVSFNTHFPGYTVLGELGRGNARVLKARHDATGELVAIKHFALNTDAQTLHRFQQESEIMTRLRHPNIVQVREIRLDAPLPYLVMELVEGGSVRQLLNEQKTLPIAQTVRLGLQMIEAFRVIHGQEVVHRDVKPENILYRQLPSGELHFLLTDFGIARLREQPATVTGQSLMTYEYASPEQFENPRNVDAATDYYSLGVVLFECLSGHVPFAMNEGVGIVTFMNTVLNASPAEAVATLGMSIPKSLGTLLTGLLTKNAPERIRQPDAVKVALKQAELEQLLAEQVNPAATQAVVQTDPATPPSPASRRTAARPAPTQAYTAPVVEPSPDRPSSRRTWTIVLASLVVAALVGAALIVWDRQSSPPKPVATGQQPAPEPPSVLEQLMGVDEEDSTAVDSATIKPVRRDSTEAERQLAAAKAAEQRRQENVKAAKLLNAQVMGFKTGLFGGISDLKIRVENPTTLTFTRVRVVVTYIKEGGGVFKEETMYFANMGPYSELIRRAPDTSRGTKVRVKITAYDSPDIPDLHPPTTPDADVDSQL